VILVQYLYILDDFLLQLGLKRLIAYKYNFGLSGVYLQIRQTIKCGRYIGN